MSHFSPFLPSFWAHSEKSRESGTFFFISDISKARFVPREEVHHRHIGLRTRQPRQSRQNKKQAE